MNNNIDFDIKSIEAFRDISDKNIKNIQESAEILKYKIGQPISKSSVIPNKILVIIKGTARLIYGPYLDSITISKLGVNDFIGLASLLRSEGCESITASNELIVMALSDKLILNLYNEELEFQKWCNSSLQKAEIVDLAKNLQEFSSKGALQIRDSYELLIKNIKLKTAINGDLVRKSEEIISIIGSANVIDNSLGKLVLADTQIRTKGELPARIFEIPISIYNKLSELKPLEKENRNKDELININSKDVKIGPLSFDKSVEVLDKYATNNNFKLIKASGLLRECLACLQMLANELGLPYRSDSIEKILRDTIKRGKKPTIQIIGNITSMMGLHSTIAKVNVNQWNRIPNLSIINWGDSFAIVKDTNSEYLEIVSPSEGIIRLNKEQVDSKFDEDYIDLILVEKSEQSPESKFGLEWLLPIINRYKSSLVQVLIASFVVQLFGLANPLMIQVIIDKVISQRSLDTLQVLGLALVVVTILGGILSSLRTFLFTETTNRIDTRLGSEVIDHLLRLPLKYFDTRPVGELSTRVAELEKIRNFFTGQALTTILDASFSLIYIVVMVIYSWLLTLIALGVVPIQILITIVGAPLIRKQIRDVAHENALTQSHLVEVLTGIQTVKAQNVESVSRWKWQELYNKYISKSFQKTIAGTALSETSKVLQQLSQLLVLWIGATLVLKGELTLGQLIAFRIISGYVTQPLLRLSTIWQNIQELRVSFERLADIIDTPEESNLKDREKIPLPSIDGNVEFENISFKFNRGKPNVLNNINLKIKSGQFVGIVGQSGSGKSTLMKLLPRLYQANTGRLLIDGYNINKVELYSLRRQIGIVPQEPLLFAGSVNDNIALTDPDSPSDEIVKASKIADAHEFIMDLKDGYSTDVGERGAGLSGGQKQRIAIARTLLSNPKLLIMDEATSALDYETERKVCEGIRKSCKSSTVFFITHRLSTVRNSDQIIMLHQGSISEVGTHDELMKLKGRYYALYLQQESS